MLDDLLEDLCNYAFVNGIGVEMIRATSTTPSICLKNKRLIVLNVNVKSNNLPFIFAHEIGHILNDDCMLTYNNGLPYYKSRCEHRADVKALDILLPIYMNHANYIPENVTPVMSQLGIPTTLSEVANNILTNLIAK
ncbi:hypothetical protein [Apilactobacillus nanyangensis]|uniref:hypothetical protein n=1 Tax=Apilactobacillus nanyangensis TaxID=2799579 RepID=UPI001943BA56|nr:hypothetical protein [Apilactobacillus nanyangensis]